MDRAMGIAVRGWAAALLAGVMVTWLLTPAFGGTGQQRAFVAHLESAERAVAAGQASLEDLERSVVGKARAIEATSASLAERAAALSDADLAELTTAGIGVSERIAAVSAAIANLLSDPRLGEILDGRLLAGVQSGLAAAQQWLGGALAELNPGLVLWNTLGSAAELASSTVGPPLTLTIPGAVFAEGRYGGGVLIPAARGDRSEQLRLDDYAVTPEGTIELWFSQDGYSTVAGQPDDGRFHSFWSPDIAPYETRGASLLTYQVPGEGWHFDIWDGTHYVRNTVSPDIAAGEWHHVAFTWSSSGSFTEVYLDGVLLNRVDEPLDITAPVPLPMQFGFDWDADDRGATSTLDDLKMWSEARTDFADSLG